jgi:hypothetical protein
MKVENYTQDLTHWNSIENTCGTKRDDKQFSKKKLARLTREAKVFFDGFGINWELYGEPDVIFNDMTIATVEWTNKKSKEKLVLSSVWFDDASGEILQAGSNHGELTL